MALHGDALEAVRHGMAWLDENYPNWRDRIDIDTIAVCSETWIYEQATGLRYDDLACAMDVNERVRLGFTTILLGDYHLEELEEAWIYALRL